MNNDQLVYRYYLKGIIELKSPLHLGSGLDENSDKDIQRDWEEKIFIPGTSLAGMLRSYFETNYENSCLISYMFGNKDDQSSQSLFTFYDLYPTEKKQKIRIRNGVKIDYETKIAEDKKKYDYEVVERETKFTLRLEVTVRKYHLEKIIEITKDEKIRPEKYIEDFIYKIITDINEYKIRIGGKTSRGFGKFKLCKTKILKIDFINKVKESLDQWIGFDWEKFKENCEYKKLNHTLLKKTTKELVMKAEFVIPNSLMIRSPNPLLNGPDVTHYLSGNKPVIPATSWTGVLHSSIENIGREIDKLKILKEMIKCIFGYAEEKSVKNENENEKNENENEIINARKSRVLIEDSIIESSELIEYTHNKIDRFTGGTVDTALFTEKPTYKGRLTLTIIFTNYRSEDRCYVGLILLALQEIFIGLQSVGGRSSIGRGILEGQKIMIKSTDGEFVINKEDIMGDKIPDGVKKQYMKPLGRKIMEESKWKK